MKNAVFPVKNIPEDFDFEFQQSVDIKVIEDLAYIEFVHNTENVVLLGPPGVGKSHLTIVHGIEAAKAGGLSLLYQCMKPYRKVKNSKPERSA